jgi:hypothetical protein
VIDAAEEEFGEWRLGARVPPLAQPRGSTGVSQGRCQEGGSRCRRAGLSTAAWRRNDFAREYS